MSLVEDFDPARQVINVDKPFPAPGRLEAGKVFFLGIPLQLLLGIPNAHELVKLITCFMVIPPLKCTEARL